LQSTVKDYSERNEALGGERASITRHFKDLKGQLTRFRANEQGRQRTLTVDAHNALDHLKEQRDRAERVMKLAIIISLSLSLSLYIYIHTYIHTHPRAER
ncbi:hypothetical protein KIPB_015108, partial [Kipferlia bialata]